MGSGVVGPDEIRAEVHRLLGQLVDYAKVTGYWHMGDGCGGGLLRELVDLAAARGLDVRDPPRRMPVKTLAVLERDGYRCCHCPTQHDLTIDHIVPRSRGGTNEFANLQTLCRECNSRKGAR